MVSREAVIAAYRFILGREPENEEIIARHAAEREDIEALRQALLLAPEFRMQTVGSAWLAPMDECPGIDVETEATEEALEQLMERVKRSWSDFGASEPYWSVLTLDAFRTKNFPFQAQAYERSGEEQVRRLFAWLDRNGVAAGALSTCIEYGCGTGRVTRWLCPRFARVMGCDISKPHLELAREYLDRERCDNVELLETSTLDGLRSLPRADLVFSVIVLQHNPPPLMAFLLRRLLEALQPGGVSYFQVPTYARGYRFELRKYLKSEPARNKVEMHVLPQREVFSIIAGSDCQVLEVLPDGSVGDPDWISNTFLVRKRQDAR